MSIFSKRARVCTEMLIYILSNGYQMQNNKRCLQNAILTQPRIKTGTKTRNIDMPEAHARLI